MGKILIVDDEKDVAISLAFILRAGGFQTLIATDGKACLSLVKKEHPDLILLDINMPGMDGGDVARILSDDPATKDIPIVYVSGMVTQGDATKVHGREFISKLSTGEEIVKRIKSILAAVR